MIDEESSQSGRPVSNKRRCQNNICEVTVVRHGETHANIQGILQGQSDSPLSTVGLEQVNAVAERLKDIHFDYVYSSSLGRAMQTASIIAEKHLPQLKVKPEKGLCEWHLGSLEGMTYVELSQQYPDFIKALASGGISLEIPGGESTMQFCERVKLFMNQTAMRHLDEKLLFITHGGALKCIFEHAVGLTNPKNKVAIADNASISRFRYDADNDSWQLLSWNDCAHLQGIKVHPTLTY